MRLWMVGSQTDAVYDSGVGVGDALTNASAKRKSMGSKFRMQRLMASFISTPIVVLPYSLLFEACTRVEESNSKKIQFSPILIAPSMTARQATDSDCKALLRLTDLPTVAATNSLA